LARLAQEADRAEGEGRTADAVSTWREALALLPPDSRQSRAIAEKLGTLTGSWSGDTPGSAASSAPSRRPRWAAGAGLLGALGLLLWKLKVVLVFVLTKAKLLLSGLAKSGTLLSMAASLGVYWTMWGWRFAAGLVLSIYVHEMGHVAALRRLGIPASAPMFVPGFGALVRMKQLPASPREEARVGLAGPVWGLGAALACALAFFATGAPFWAAITQWGARINLFNLIPVRPLDGGRGFAALSRGQVAIVVLAFGVSLLWSGEGMLWLLLLVGGARLIGGGVAGPGDRRAAVEFVVLVAALTALTALPVALPPR
jgi:Zn-dependent protease